MTTEKFKLMWTQYENNLCPVPKDRLIELGLSQGSIKFLTISGLPRDAAPFLSFFNSSDEDFGRISSLASQYDGLGSDFQKFIVIGFCGNGDPIAIDTENDDRVVWLDHEDDFVPYFFNSSVNCLAECLLHYKEFVNLTIKYGGDSAFLNAQFTDQHYATLKENLFTADAKILTEKGFWDDEFEMLLINREAESGRL